MAVIVTKQRPNKAHAVDAPIALLFAIVYQWRRATDAPRSASRDFMKVLGFLPRILCAAVLLATPCSSPKGQYAVRLLDAAAEKGSGKRVSP